MCIVLLTTAHPKYALIVIDNRDEFILRPTSRPHWWTPSGSSAVTPTNGSTPARNTPAPGTTSSSSSSLKPPPQILDHLILSSRDLQRPEHGTWLGITTAGHFAVLTNFREDTPNDAAHPIHGQRSRGGMVTAWLTADRAETTEQFVERMLAGGVRGVGGFSLICGKLRKKDFVEAQERKSRGPLAIISNRADQVAQVPWIAGRRGEVYGLSNASYDDPEVWPKVRDGKAALAQVTASTAQDAAQEAVVAAQAEKAVENLAAAGVSEPDALREALFAILDRDTLPQRPDLSFEEQIPLLKHSVFIPAIGDEAHRLAMEKAVAGGPRLPLDSVDDTLAGSEADAELASEERPDQQAMGFMTGLYGTQRQTVILVDWEGNVSFTERALWDANGNAIPRGKGDVHFNFPIEGWNE
ncbi:hypothetical protein SBRCBS47491_006459 [Sporothrix bragantina]|uniref:DUF833 domain-containing protein n=1 Tax=Sporothrix bragantina TaxID=671064 RepID=A0ABP0C536_9PEZI